MHVKAAALMWQRIWDSYHIPYTLKTGTPGEEGNPILKLLRGVSRPEIQLEMGIHSEHLYVSKLIKHIYIEGVRRATVSHLVYFHLVFN